MKTGIHLGGLVVLWGLYIMLIGCEKDGPDCVMIPPPSGIVVSGTITDEVGSPIESIQIVADSSSFYIGKWRDIEQKEYSDKKGLYRIQYTSDVDFESVKWPTELTVIAKDTSDIYETQTQTFAIELRQRYQNLPIGKKYSYILDGYVTADFVLQKKKKNQPKE